MGKRQQKFSKKLGVAAGTLILALVSFYLNPQTNSTVNTTSKSQSTGSQESFKRIHYTRHAKCRMDCRFFTKKEVEDVIQNGRVNKRKSDPTAKPCPVTAKEKKTIDGQNARIVFARCGKTIKIITAIDLGKKHRCSCS